MDNNLQANDPSLKSFIDVTADSHFPIQNLPFGVFSDRRNPHARVGVAIGDHVLDLAVIEQASFLAIGQRGTAVFQQPCLNDFIALGRGAWRAARNKISELLRVDNPALRDNPELRSRALVPMRDVTMHMPVEVPGYTDFYSSKEHATNVGSMFRDPKNALLPNWLHIPIGYNGRASSIVVSGTAVRRPNGQLKLPDSEQPILAPCRKLDFELETAFIVGQGNALGEPIGIDDAPAHMFGMVLLNDWSARDIQQWEYVPLGPFNSKTFASSISPWVVTMDALEPFRVDNPVQDPQPLPYLRQSQKNAYDIELQVTLRAQGAAEASTISRTNFRTMYWTMAQQLAHHTISGCNARIGDLMGSGTISGAAPDSFGSMLELTWNGQRPLTLKDGSQRSFIQDGDEVGMAGWCERDGVRIGFGAVTGVVLPAPQLGS